MPTAEGAKHRMRHPLLCPLSYRYENMTQHYCWECFTRLDLWSQAGTKLVTEPSYCAPIWYQVGHMTVLACCSLDVFNTSFYGL